MPIARKHLIDLDATSVYHCVSRCVRRAYLCGEDQITGKNFEHRRQWLSNRFKFLAKHFSIDICAYAVMSNHYHLVLKVDKDQIVNLTEDEVVEKWTAVYHSGNILVKRYQAGTATEAEKIVAKQIIGDWRVRLTDISWFMRALNEYIARKANKEDECKGHFWESRFKSQALLDNKAIIGCMVYVDLNPIRANIASDLQDSDFTSIQERIQALETPVESKLENQADDSSIHNVNQPKSILPFSNGIFEPEESTRDIQFQLIDYIALADWTGRNIREDKKGFINPNKPAILTTLNIDETTWHELSTEFEKKFAGWAGDASVLYPHSNKHGQYYSRGVG